MIRIPKDDLALWTKAITDDCMEGSEDRRTEAVRLSWLFENGDAPRARGENIVKPAVERLAGTLYSPQRLAFAIAYAEPPDPKTAAQAALVSQMLTVQFNASHSDMVFAGALQTALIGGCGILKVRPSHDGPELFEVLPENFGVLRDGNPDLERQEAVCEVSYPSLGQVREMLGDRADAEELMERISQTAEKRSAPASDTHIVIGQNHPIGSAGSGTLFAGSGVGDAGNGYHVPTVELRELWVHDEEREGRLTTIQLITPDIIIRGENARTSALTPGLENPPTPLASSFPYLALRPFPARSNFWGWSFAASLERYQESVNALRLLIEKAIRRKIHPAVGVAGFQGLPTEDADAFLSGGALLISDNANARMSVLQGDEIAPLYQALDAELAIIDRFAGFPAVLRGEGEGGVRSQGHAETLVRTASPRLVRPATEVEQTLADVAALMFRVMQLGDGRITGSPETGPFLLASLYRGWHMTVDSHSGSPVFSQDERTLVLELARMGIIAPEDVIRFMRLPEPALLTQHLKEREAAQARAALLAGHKTAPHHQ